MRNNDEGFGIIGVFLVICVLACSCLAGYRLYIVQQSMEAPSHTSSSGAKATEAHKRIAAVGDIVCDPGDTHADGANPDYCQDKQVAQQIVNMHPDALLLLGDLQYSDGAPRKFTDIFSKNWQQFKSISYPTPGNHEYATPHAAGYYKFFKDTPVDTQKGYYAFRLGAWQILSLNSNCNDIDGCDQNSEQIRWARKELGLSQSKCTLAFWHHPRFTSGEYSDDANLPFRSDAMWANLLQHKAEVTLNGHDHLYERFQKQTATGDLSEAGIRQFTVGTGGKSHYTHEAIAKNSQKIIDDQFGILVMDLYPAHYTWQFVNISGDILDSGTENCH